MSNKFYKGGHYRKMKEQEALEAYEAAHVQAGVTKQQYGCVWVVACVVIVGLALLALLAVKPMSPAEVEQSIERGKQTVDEGRAAPLTVLVPQHIRECAYAGECYSWGGTPQPWHKTCVAPILVLVAIGTFLYTLMRLLTGR